jgi:D-amino-acid dehydrogenase
LNAQYKYMNTIVLGGGVIGVATAFYLRQQGAEVTLIEREPDVALSTSFGNAGVIAPGYVTPWAAPGMPTKILKYLFKPASPLIFRPTFDPAQWRWIARWLRECDLERFRVNKQRMQRIAYYSRECLHEFRRCHPFD